ncbi:SH2 domain-containing protein [Chryseobacterium geocarposphaerae]|uniref:Uncharacterized protein n=1 Tax=Chryseobacterium geocarposphaerae TaxID=1416776 RepID=A0A2M9C373_9FLAO|nr:hypothetical protein [Chryseobacterium geocarposphaerae]PJJ64863.1 hypothetical protein CLV73_3232 [Chryseobacterium geocarposphaerae]
MESIIFYLKRNTTLIITSLIIILICQLEPIYAYWEIEKKLDAFKSTKINNQIIVGINEIHYKPGNYLSKYLGIKLKDNNQYPVLIENKEEIGKITVDSVINKDSNSSIFTINNSQSFILKDLSSEKLFDRIFMFIVSLAGIFSFYSQTRKQKNNE